MVNNVREVKIIVNTITSEFDDFLRFCEKNITDKILDYCNIDVIPERLNTLIQEFMIEQYTINKNGVGEGVKEVTGVSDNGQSVSFKNVGGVSSMSTNVDEFIKRNINTLNRYRKIRW